MLLTQIITMVILIASILTGEAPMKIEIKSRNATVLFAHECESNTIRLTLEAAIKARANLAGANLADANLARANLADANLARANLAGANLARADLTRAYLADANLAGADLTRAYLEDANLAGANLAGADLTRAYLEDANLAGADLTRADLTRADLTRAYLADAKDVIDAGTPNGWRAVGWIRDGVLSVRVGCRDKRLSEGRKYWAGKENRREVLAALDYVEAIAALRGWVMK
jgi:hypothetical protein